MFLDSLKGPSPPAAGGGGQFADAVRVAGGARGDGGRRRRRPRQAQRHDVGRQSRRQDRLPRQGGRRVGAVPSDRSRTVRARREWGGGGGRVAQEEISVEVVRKKAVASGDVTALAGVMHQRAGHVVFEDAVEQRVRHPRRLAAVAEVRAQHSEFLPLRERLQTTRKAFWALLMPLIIIGVVLWVFLNRTRVGMMIRAGVDDRAMLAASGVNVQLVFAITFAIGAGLAGLAGLQPLQDGPAGGPAVWPRFLRGF